ncbi:MAG: hypothetical protein H6510_06935 [Acidobacteria bacterium]|nr:hypothetical protein [Acidobacteriota bacterium]MCB9397529.1 hypothetical protein [Acidobacteriota bacterium]
MIILVGWILLQTPAIEAVREGSLDLYPYYRISSLFENYPFWESHNWTEQAQAKNVQVTFHGVFLQSKALVWLQENNQYEWKTAFKSMQLANLYGTGDPKEEQVEVCLVFEVEPDQSFAVRGGYMVFHGPKDRTVKLADKAVLEWIKATYRKRDPFAALIFGLPYE